MAIRIAESCCWSLLLAVLSSPQSCQTFAGPGLDEAAWATAGTDAIVNTICGRKAVKLQRAATPPAWG